jgi:hypothetical protein
METERRLLTGVGLGRMTLKVILKKYDVKFKGIHEDKKKIYRRASSHEMNNFQDAQSFWSILTTYVIFPQVYK